MGFLIGFIRTFFIIAGLLLALVFAAALMLVGAVFMLLTGRRPKVRVFRPQDLGGPFARGEFDPFAGPRSRQPMKDVTPHPVGELENQRGIPSH